MILTLARLDILAALGYAHLDRIIAKGHTYRKKPKSTWSRI